MGSKVSTLCSEQLSLNCAFLALPQFPSTESQRVVQMFNSSLVIDTLVENFTFGGSPQGGLANGLMGSHRVMVYSLTFTAEEYKKCGRTTPQDVFVGDEVIVSFLVIFTCEPQSLKAKLRDFKKYLKKYNDSYLKSEGNGRATLQELTTVVRGRSMNDNMIIYELSTSGIERHDVEIAEKDLINQPFDRFDRNTVSIRHFTSRDTKVLYKFTEALLHKYKKEKTLEWSGYRGYVSDTLAAHRTSPHFELHEPLSSKSSKNCLVGNPRSPGTIMLVSDKHFRLIRNARNNPLERKLRGLIPPITLDSLYIYENLHAFANSHHLRVRKSVTSDLFVLPDDKVLLEPRPYKYTGTH